MHTYIKNRRFRFGKQYIKRRSSISQEKKKTMRGEKIVSKIMEKNETKADTSKQEMDDKKNGAEWPSQEMVAIDNSEMNCIENASNQTHLTQSQNELAALHDVCVCVVFWL